MHLKERKKVIDSINIKRRSSFTNIIHSTVLNREEEKKTRLDTNAYFNSCLVFPGYPATTTADTTAVIPEETAKQVR